MTFTTTLISGAEALGHRAAILDRLSEYNVATAGPANVEPLCVAIAGDDGEIRGGLFGKTVYDWLFVEFLIVPEELRGTGAGSNLIARAEQFARERGCIGAWLDTFSFQARGFYEKLGYSLVGTIADHPVGGARHFMMKRWSERP